MKTYDPDDVVMIVGGHIVQGYADGTFINAERNSDAFARQGGANGEQARAKSNDKSGLYTFTLMQTSLSNGVLQGFANADELSNAGKVPVLIRDASGSELTTSAVAWVQKNAGRSHGKELEDRTWILETGVMAFVGGGTVDNN